MGFENVDLDFMSGYNKIQPVLAETEDIEFLNFLLDHEWKTRRRYRIMERIITRQKTITTQKQLKNLWERIYGSARTTTNKTSE